jgi:hypothetical protein
MLKSKLSLVAGVLALSATACGSDDPTGSGGEGKLSFTTWGEEYIEDEIPVDSTEVTGFVDGWTIQYDKFLVNFQNIVVADAGGAVGARFDKSKLFDNKVKGVKTIVDFDKLPAKAWSRVSYEIAPVTDATELGPNVPEADRTMMKNGGYSVFVSATATKGAVSKHFAWGFAIGTRYNECHSEQEGRDEAGVIVTNNSSLEAQLTTHGDHLYYDRLQASPDPAIKTSLRFDALAAADTGDGEITLEELNAVLIDVRLYDPSGLPADTLGEFVTSLARTIGHFRGEGECTISKL